MRPRFSLAFLLSTLPAVLAAEDRDALEDLGAEVFGTHCAACHGADGRTGATGSIRHLGRSTYLTALRGVDQMPAVNGLEQAEVEALILWLGTPLESPNG